MTVQVWMKLQQVNTPVKRKQQTMKGCVNLKMDLYCRGSFPAHPGVEKQDAKGTWHEYFDWTSDILIKGRYSTQNSAPFWLGKRFF